jgi:hypothetical protein
MKIVTQSNFVDTGSAIFLPRPCGAIIGQARHQWFENLTGRTPSIASPDFWEYLIGRHTLRTLAEYEDGTWEILEET